MSFPDALNVARVISLKDKRALGREFMIIPSIRRGHVLLKILHKRKYVLDTFNDKERLEPRPVFVCMIRAYKQSHIKIINR